MPKPIITAAPVVLQPRALFSTLCWYASSTVEDITVWAAVTYNPDNLFVTSYNNFPVWIDACVAPNGESAWCNTATLPTMCSNGYIRGVGFTTTCSGSGSTCITELMYQLSGDATAKLSKVGCGVTYSARTYFIESPPVRRAVTSSTHVIVSTTAPVVTSGASAIMATSTANAFGIPTPTPTARSASSGGKTDEPNAGLIAGSTVGGVAILGIIGLAALWIMKRHRRQNSVRGSEAPQYNSSSVAGPYGAVWHPQVAEVPVYPAEMPHPDATYYRSELEAQDRNEAPGKIWRKREASNSH